MTLETRLEQLAESGTHRSTEDVWASVTAAELVPTIPANRPTRRFWLSLASVSAVVIVAVGAVVTLTWMRGGSFGDGADVGPGAVQPTIPPGTEATWTDSELGNVHADWRATESGTELCWQTAQEEGCFDVDFHAPEALVIAVGDDRVMVFAEVSSRGRLPAYVMLHLDDGTKVDVDLDSVFSNRDLTVLWGLSPSLDPDRVLFGVTVETPQGTSSCGTDPHRLIAEHLAFDGGSVFQDQAMVDFCGFRLTTAELSDWMSVAEQDGLDLEEVLRTRGSQTEVVSLLNQLQAEFPDSYAGGSVDPDSPWVAFRDAAPARAYELLGHLPIEIIENRGFSEEELNQTLLSVVEDLWDLGITDLQGSYDQVTGEVEIQVARRHRSLVGDVSRWESPNPAVEVSIDFVWWLPRSGND